MQVEVLPSSWLKFECESTLLEGIVADSEGEFEVTLTNWLAVHQDGLPPLPTAPSQRQQKSEPGRNMGGTKMQSRAGLDEQLNSEVSRELSIFLGSGQRRAACVLVALSWLTCLHFLQLLVQIWVGVGVFWVPGVCPWCSKPVTHSVVSPLLALTVAGYTCWRGLPFPRKAADESDSWNPRIAEP